MWSTNDCRASVNISLMQKSISFRVHEGSVCAQTSFMQYLLPCSACYSTSMDSHISVSQMMPSCTHHSHQITAQSLQESQLLSHHWHIHMKLCHLHLKPLKEKQKTNLKHSFRKGCHLFHSTINICVQMYAVSPLLLALQLWNYSVFVIFSKQIVRSSRHWKLITTAKKRKKSLQEDCTRRRYFRFYTSCPFQHQLL